MADRLPVTGGAGARPPDHAPREVSSTSIALAPEQLDQIRRNERDVPVFNPPVVSDDQLASGLGCSIPELHEMRRTGLGLEAVRARALADPAITRDADGFDIRVTTSPAPVGGVASTKGADVPLRKALRRPGGGYVTPRPAVDIPADSTQTATIGTIATNPEAPSAPAPGQSVSEITLVPPAPAAPPAVVDPAIAAAAELAELRKTRPAASNSDSPARGIPKPVADPGKQVTGGFGDVGEAEYFPLDGLELKAVVESLMDAVHARIQDDLRFSIAITYARVTARVVVEIEAHASDTSFQIVKKFDHLKTPLEVARAHGDEIVFAVSADHAEMLPDGTSVHPPNATRMALGLEVPRKQIVPGPGGTQRFISRKS
jgi:hypothetical protein